MNFDMCLCSKDSKGFESPSFTIWSIGYLTGLEPLEPQADSKTSLIVKYIQAGDLGAKYGGNIIDYELRPGYDMDEIGWIYSDSWLN